MNQELKSFFKKLNNYLDFYLIYSKQTDKKYLIYVKKDVKRLQDEELNEDEYQDLIENMQSKIFKVFLWTIYDSYWKMIKDENYSKKYWKELEIINALIKNNVITLYNVWINNAFYFVWTLKWISDVKVYFQDKKYF